MGRRGGGAGLFRPAVDWLRSRLGSGRGPDGDGASARDPRMPAALDDTVDADAITPDPAWRTDRDTVWRMDGREPDEVFENGFAPKDPSYTDLAGYVADKDQESAFVSTSRWDMIQHQFKTRWMYEIDAPGGIDVPETLGENFQKWTRSEREVAFPGGIRPEFVRRAHAMFIDENGNAPQIDNPNYRPGRG